MPAVFPGHVEEMITFRKTGCRIIGFDVPCFVQKTGPEPQIIVFIACDDEQEAMKDPGPLRM